ncbi:MAG TPA: aminodeoxychorismate/anthranilate synthase component II [Pirellulales bacterium]|jgi:anthranilate synthase component 2
MNTVILDNYDSFTFNLYQYVGEIDARPLVFRNDQISFAELARLAPERIIISPGPGRADDPEYFGICKRAILELGPRVPVLGVCLGHQGIVHAFGGRIVRAESVMHGKTSRVFHQGDPMFASIPSSFEAMRYHSLIAERASLPDALRVSAETADGVIMAVRHVEFPIFGVQFHPESILTSVGKQLLKNFLLDSQASPQAPQPAQL